MPYVHNMTLHTIAEVLLNAVKNTRVVLLDDQRAALSVPIAGGASIEMVLPLGRERHSVGVASESTPTPGFAHVYPH
ncbi:MAG: hypothetical protein RLZZ403_849 [Pseudomonadota bacterium]|jgi:hypothetical protein